MTGPEHYRAAESLLRDAGSTERGSAAETSLFAEAQVHATLAVAAATAEVEPVKEWRAAVVGDAGRLTGGEPG